MNQYPIFPWILAKYNDMTDEKKLEFRQLNYALSVQDESKRLRSIKKYDEDKEEKFKVHFRCHYSTSAFVCYYLLRLNPFTQSGIKLQTMKFENTNRMFISMKEIWEILEKYSDNRELIPEFYYQLEMYLNFNCNDFGIRSSDSKRVNDVLLPKKDSKDMEVMEMIYKHRSILESTIVSNNLIYWIDNIFGANQLIESKESLNVYNKECYESELKLSEKFEKYKSKYSVEKSIDKIRDKINTILNFGQTPHQLFLHKHSKKTNQTKNFVKDDLYKLTEFIATNKKECIKFKNGIVYFNFTKSYIYLINKEKEIEVVDKNTYKQKYKFKPKSYLNFKILENFPIYKDKYILTELKDAKFFIIGRYLDYTLKIYEIDILVKEIFCDSVKFLLILDYNMYNEKRK